MSGQRVIRLLVACSALFALQATAEEGWTDVLDRPAATSPLASRTLYNGLAQAGQRVVAVGQRGHIVYSDDGGKSWTQAVVPVSSDLVAVDFPTPELGWAVGHDGIILHTTDAGANWTRQLDGRELGQVLLDFYSAAVKDGTIEPPEEAERLAGEAQLFADQGPENPFLSVFFENERQGFVVGAYNLILRTEDGGENWQPWLHRVENPRAMHLYAIDQVDGETWITGEQGLLLKLNPEEQRFIAMQLPYEGTLFGLTGGPEGVIVFGLRGNAFHSNDAGLTWNKIETGLTVGLTSGSAAGEKIVLVSQAGHVLGSMDGGLSFTLAPVAQPQPAAAVLALSPDALVVGGPRGLGAIALANDRQ